MMRACSEVLSYDSFFRYGRTRARLHRFVFGFGRVHARVDRRLDRIIEQLGYERRELLQHEQLGRQEQQRIHRGEQLERRYRACRCGHDEQQLQQLE